MHAKEGAGGSRGEGEDGVDALCVYIYNEGRGQRELTGVKTGYDIVC